MFSLPSDKHCWERRPDPDSLTNVCEQVDKILWNDEGVPLLIQKPYLCLSMRGVDGWQLAHELVHGIFQP